MQDRTRIRPPVDRALTPLAHPPAGLVCPFRVKALLSQRLLAHHHRTQPKGLDDDRQRGRHAVNSRTVSLCLSAFIDYR